MARQFAGFFDSIEGDERSYVAEEFAQYFRAFYTDGVKELGDNLRVKATGTSMQVVISPGLSAIQGYFYGLFNDGGDPLQLIIIAPGAQTRIDRIVLRLDRTTDVRGIIPAVIKGSSSVVPPVLTRNSDLWEISLAQIAVRPGVSVIEQADITDERADDTVCGIIEPYRVKQYIDQGVKTTDSPTFAGINAPHIQAISTVTGLQAALDGKAAASHTQAISTVTGLQAALDGKAGASHTQAISTVTGLQAALDGKAAASHTQAISTVTGLQAALDGKLGSTATAANSAKINGKNVFIQSGTPTAQAVGDIWIQT